MKSATGRSMKAGGKVSRKFLESVVLANLGARRGSVIIGPGNGRDNAVISLGKKKVLVATSDPLSVIPAVGLEWSAWLSVNLLASDITTSGVDPEFAMLDFNFPLEMELNAARMYLKAVGEECGRLGIAIVGGHTGRYPGSGYTVVGAGTMFGTAGQSGYVSPTMAEAGDQVLVTKGAAIGATAVLSSAFPRTVGAKIGRASLRKAQALLPHCSTVGDARIARRLGLRRAVTSMHDATEGGVLGGLYETSSACSKPIVVDRERVPVSKEAAAVCRCFGLDPLTTLSEGTLIITCEKDAIANLRGALSREGIDSSHVGQVVEGRGPALRVLGGRGPAQEYTPPDSDPYWAAYMDANNRGLD